MLTLPEIRERLKDRKSGVVAKAARVDRQTIYNVMDPNSNPTYKTLKALSDYLTGVPAPDQEGAE